jgi:hypothetical protein
MYNNFLNNQPESSNLKQQAKQNQFLLGEAEGEREIKNH